MWKCHVEIDFFELEKRKAASRASSPQSTTASSRTRSAGGIQSVVSRINPQLLRMVIGAGAARSSDSTVTLGPSGELFPSSNPSSPTAAGDASRASPPPLLPVINPSYMHPVAETDLSIVRRKSLQRFLEKRRERLASASPYMRGTSKEAKSWQ